MTAAKSGVENGVKARRPTEGSLKHNSQLFFEMGKIHQVPIKLRISQAANQLIS